MPGGSLLKLYIYNNTISLKEEQQHQNVLFYHPEVPLDEQLMDIGLSAAFGGFHFNFDNDTGISSCCTDGFQMVWFEAETDFWIGITVRRQPENAGFVEDAEATALTALLKQGYRLFRMQYGCMSKHFRETLPELRDNLKSFWKPYIQWITGPIAQGLDLYDTLDGVEYLPVDRSAYLKMQSVVNHLETEFPSIQASMVIVDNLLLYTGLNLDDTHTLYKFLSRRQRTTKNASPMDNVLYLCHPYARGDESYSGFLTATCGAFEPGKGTLRNFVSEKFNIGKKSSGAYKPISIWIGPRHESNSNGKDLKKTTLVVFQSQRMILTFLCDPDELAKQTDKDVNGRFFGDLHSFLTDTLARSSQSITQNITRSIVWDEAYQYIYFNRMNLALKSSLKRKGADAQESLRRVERLQIGFEDTPGMKEAWVRTKENTWVVGRKSGSREFYSVFEGKSHLTEAHEEVKRVSQVFFNGIFVD
eukprot:TRINITY_DN27377_c0_g1_i1.p1 TRINITY_DN27377_c0_g1~~TRINITY_DN27377_c0_g1_i1.p1  ORF type:complete len:482 (+),score=91.33 TRINITY_DN27377_c0_g1_i1:25-1446(+)